MITFRQAFSVKICLAKALPKLPVSSCNKDGLIREKGAWHTISLNDQEHKVLTMAMLYAKIVVNH